MLFVPDVGTKLTYTIYDKKGKLSGTQTTYYYKKETKNDTQFYFLETKVLDPKGKELTSGELVQKYYHDTLIFDINQFSGKTEAFKDMKLTVSGDALLFPGKLKDSCTLNGGTITMSFDPNSPMAAMGDIVMNIGPKTFVKTDTISTPQGTKTGYKVSYETEVESKMPLFKGKSFSESWYVQNMGLTRTISYKNNKKEMEMVLTQMETVK